MTLKERDFAREIAATATAPMEGYALSFDAALEMATSNVAVRIDPLLREAIDSATKALREENGQLRAEAQPEVKP